MIIVSLTLTVNSCECILGLHQVFKSAHDQLALTHVLLMVKDHYHQAGLIAQF